MYLLAALPVTYLAALQISFWTAMFSIVRLLRARGVLVQGTSVSVWTLVTTSLTLSFLWQFTVHRTLMVDAILQENVVNASPELMDALVRHLAKKYDLDIEMLNGGPSSGRGRA